MQQDLSSPPLDCLTVFVDLLIRVHRNSKLISGNLLSPLGAQSEDIGAALQMLLTGVRSHLQCRQLSHNPQ